MANKLIFLCGRKAFEGGHKVAETSVHRVWMDKDRNTGNACTVLFDLICTWFIHPRLAKLFGAIIVCSVDLGVN